MIERTAPPGRRPPAGARWLLLLAATATFAGCSRKPAYPPGCYLNGSVHPATRRELESAAGRFYDLLRSRRYEDAWSGSSAQLRARVDKTQVALTWTSLAEILTVPQRLATEEIAVVVIAEGARGPQELQCTDPADTTGGRRMMTTDQPFQAYLIQSAAVRNTVYNYASIWYFEAGGWKLAAVGARPRTAQGHDWRHYLEVTHEQRAKKNLRNAALLYNLTMDLLVPAPWVRPDQLEKLEREQRRLMVEDLPRGRVMTWVAADSTVFHPYQVGYDLTAQGLAVKFLYEVPAPADTSLVERQAARLADFIRQSFPEYQEVFSTIWLQATTRVDHQPVWEGTFPLGTRP